MGTDRVSLVLLPGLGVGDGDVCGRVGARRPPRCGRRGGVQTAHPDVWLSALKSEKQGKMRSFTCLQI